MLSASPIPHNSIHLLIITTDFVTLQWIFYISVDLSTNFFAHFSGC